MRLKPLDNVIFGLKIVIFQQPTVICLLCVKYKNVFTKTFHHEHFWPQYSMVRQCIVYPKSRITQSFVFLPNEIYVALFPLFLRVSNSQYHFRIWRGFVQFLYIINIIIIISDKYNIHNKTMEIKYLFECLFYVIIVGLHYCK